MRGSKLLFSGYWTKILVVVMALSLIVIAPLSASAFQEESNISTSRQRLNYQDVVSENEPLTEALPLTEEEMAEAEGEGWVAWIAGVAVVNAIKAGIDYAVDVSTGRTQFSWKEAAYKIAKGAIIGGIVGGMLGKFIPVVR